MLRKLVLVVNGTDGSLSSSNNSNNSGSSSEYAQTDWRMCEQRLMDLLKVSPELNQLADAVLQCIGIRDAEGHCLL